MHISNETIVDHEKASIPVSIDEWESALVQYFLAIGNDGDASDIHSFEVNRHTLAFACGLDASRGKEVENSFHKALTESPHLLQTLKTGSLRNPSDSVPNCFAPLAMTLFIDVLLDNQTDSGNEFRAKLADWLRINRTFSDLRGVALMWEELAKWLDARAAAGAPFRRLVLPAPPKNWKHIGFTRRLSFPNRADIRLVSQVLETISVSDSDNPVIVLGAFSSAMNRRVFSTALKDALDDFRHSYYAQRRAIAEHRFWRLIMQVRVGAQRVVQRAAMLEITYTEDSEREFRVFDDVSYTKSFARLGDAIADSVVANSVTLGASVKRGILFFRQCGIGRWRAESDLARCRDRVYVVFRAQFSRTLGQRLGVLEHFGDWCFTASPMPVSIVEMALRAIYSLAASSDRLFRPTIFDGIRVHGAWLGLPGFLPCIESDTDKIEIVGDSPDEPFVRVQVEQGLLQLTSDTPLSGVYHVAPYISKLETSVPWRLRVQFVERAVPHGHLEGVRRTLSPLSEWASVSPMLVNCVRPIDMRWDKAEEPMERLLEAIYANGASGWDESELISLVRRAGAEPASDTWRTLRMLQDGGVLEPRLRQYWRGRAWTLAAPSIVVSKCGDVEIALAEGALCAHLLEDFRLAVEGLGGSVFRFRGRTPWSVPVVGATGVSQAALAARLGWEFKERVPSPSAAPLSLICTERRGEHFRVASTWCWRLRRFVNFGAVESNISLIQRVHVSGADHDVYQIESRGRSSYYLSRHAAIIAAHAFADVPLFEFVNDRIELRAREGALPDMLASALRRRSLGSAGLLDGLYTYSASIEDARWILSLLPGCIAGVTAQREISPGEALSIARRSHGARRVQWQCGRLVI